MPDALQIIAAMRAQEPVAFVDNLARPQPHCVTSLRYCTAAQVDLGEHLLYTPLYTRNAALLDALAAEVERMNQALGTALEVGAQNGAMATSLRAELQRERAEVERLTRENHNLNWALGTPGYEQMATPEEQAEHEAAVAQSNALLSRMAERKARFDALVPACADLLEHLERLTRERDEARADAERWRAESFDAVCNMVARDLPGDGSYVTITLERHAGTVNAADWDGNEWSDGADIDGMAERVRVAVEWCKAQADAAKEQSNG